MANERLRTALLQRGVTPADLADTTREQLGSTMSTGIDHCPHLAAPISGEPHRRPDHF